MNTCATGRCGDFVVISRSFLGCTNDGQIWSNTIIVVLLTTCVHSGCGLAGMAAGGGNYDLTCNRGGVASGGVAVTNDMCSYTTTTHTRDHSYYPLFHIHHTPHTNRPTQSGQHFPLFLDTGDTHKYLPQLPERPDRPVHTANTKQCTWWKAAKKQMAARATSSY